ncbi:MAG TPA: hypothetical protein VFU21_02550 [Kofleriaceae bacterium]|nr:hypothetical protein [Kofleriaceae bacterium]
MAPALVAAAIVAVPARGEAFEIETSTTSGCHERVTGDAIAAAGWPDGASPPAPDETDERIMDDVPFELPARDPWTLALLIGVRHNDIGGANPFDLPALARIHDDPALQPEHCLRRRQDDGEPGDASALEACRAFILAEIEAGLGGGDEVDLDATEPVEVYLTFRGRIELDLAGYPFRLGRALHALEDSFTHAFRDPDGQEVRHVLNWIESNLEGGDEAVDGHPHIAQLDRCGAEDRVRVEAATAAATDLVAALADPEGGRSGRLARAAEVLERHTARQEGCTAGNDWCGAPEASLPTTSCSIGGGGSSALAAFLLLLPLARRRRLLAATLVLLAAAPAAAEEDDAAELPDEQQEQVLEKEEKVLERLPDPVARTWGAAISAGGAFDRGAAMASAGLRWNPWESLGFGLDAEYNPWFSISAGDVAPGAASLYVPVIWRLKRFGTWELRTTAYAGATMMLFDLVGVDRGQIGPFVGWNPLGLALPLGPDFKLVVKPGDIAVAVPRATDIPFYYHQYRFTIGVEWFP